MEDQEDSLPRSGRPRLLTGRKPKSPKPQRLRLACTECNKAKVKCSGQKEGCTRCEKVGLKCEYKVSLVGRTPKRKHSTWQDSGDITDLDSPTTQGPSQGPTQEMPAVPMQFSYPPVPYPSPSAFANNPSLDNCNIGIEMMLNTDLSFLQPNAGLGHIHVPAPSPMFHNGSASDTGDTMPESLRVQIEESSGFGAAASGFQDPLYQQDSVAASLRAQLAEKSVEGIPSAFRDKQMVSKFSHTSMIMRLIDDLEVLIGEHTLPVDRALRLNSTALHDLRTVVQTDSFRLCSSCPSLIFTAFTLVVGIYELILMEFMKCPPPEASPSRQDGEPPKNQQQQQQQKPSLMGAPTFMTPPSSTVSVSVRGRVPVFLFGDFELSASDQIALRKTMMARHLRKCADAFEFCIKEITNNEGAEEDGDAEGGGGHPKIRVNLTMQNQMSAEIRGKLESCTRMLDKETES